MARAELTKRENLSGWPDNAAYFPIEHKDGVWVVMAMAGTPDADVRYVVTLLIEEDGRVLAYKRNWEGEPRAMRFNHPPAGNAGVVSRLTIGPHH